MMETRWVVGLSVVVLAGCYQSQVLGAEGGVVGVFDGAPIDRDGGSGVDPREPDAGPPPPTDQLDLLFLVDDSSSMELEQASLVDALPALFRAITTGDYDGDGLADGRAFTSLHVGVITSDMGTGGYHAPTCHESEYGHDGVLRTQGNLAAAWCMATYPPFLDWRPGAPSDAFARSVGCVATVGWDGCGFEQQLEATLKALTPNAAQPGVSSDFVPIGTAGAPSGLDAPFFNMSGGNGDDENAGFVRPDSMLAVVVFSDEEDCSARDPGIFDPDSHRYRGILNLRCFEHPDALHPVSRYVRGLAQLRRHPSRLAFFVLGGVPVDLAPAPGEAIHWPRLVSDDPAVRDERMQEVIDPSMPSQLTPSCNVPGRGVAFPPIRMLRAARGLEALGARVSVGSICQEDYAVPFASFLHALRR